jgi:hypothetical protein
MEGGPIGRPGFSKKKPQVNIKGRLEKIAIIKNATNKNKNRRAEN